MGGKLGYSVKIPNVEISKENYFRVQFVLERLVNRKLHYMMGSIEYSVLRVAKRLALEFGLIQKLHME